MTKREGQGTGLEGEKEHGDPEQPEEVTGVGLGQETWTTVSNPKIKRERKTSETIQKAPTSRGGKSEGARARVASR